MYLLFINDLIFIHARRICIPVSSNIVTLYLDSYNIIRADRPVWSLCSHLITCETSMTEFLLRKLTIF